MWRGVRGGGVERCERRRCGEVWRGVRGGVGRCEGRCAPPPFATPLFPIACPCVSPPVPWYMNTRDLPPSASLQQGGGGGVGFGKNIVSEKSSPSLNSMPCSFILPCHMVTMGWVFQVRGKPGGGSGKYLHSHTLPHMG